MSEVWDRVYQSDNNFFGEEPSSFATLCFTHMKSINAKKVLEEALARLNETQRSLVMLKDYEGYSYEEIGNITGLNSSQVKVYLHRARIQLKNFLVRPENVI